MKPVTRRAGLLIRELPDELLVYDRRSHRAHCLNRTAATVFLRADGTRTMAEIARLVAPDETAGEPVVAEALDRLGEAGLVEVGPPESVLTRRDVVRRMGLGAAILLPAVASILAPTPAEAAASCEYISFGGSCAGKAISNTPCSCYGSPGSLCTGTCIPGVPEDTCSDC
jgi:hypothetical protein